MKLKMTYNGITLPIEVLHVEGRGVVEFDTTTLTVPSRDSSYYVKRRLPDKPMPVEYVIENDGLTDIRTKIDELNAVLIVGNVVPITFSDEPDKTYYVYLNGSPEGDEHYFISHGVLPFMRKPYKYGSKETANLSELEEEFTTDFAGKIADSTVKNPNMASMNMQQSDLQPPNGSWGSYNQIRYNSISQLDGDLAITSTNRDGDLTQQLFSFDLIQVIERKFGITIPGATISDKAQWCRDNITRLNCNWWGWGSYPGGNMASLARWYNPQETWVLNSNGSTTDADTVTRIRNVESSNVGIPRLIDSNGFVHFMAYAEPSDGASLSRLLTDYVDLEASIKLPTIMVEGNAEAYPFFDITFTQSTSGYTLTHGQSGEHIRLIRNFSPGDVLEIDTSKRKITLNGIVNMTILSFDSSWFTLKPGYNGIFTDPSSAATVEVTYRSRWY
ncbi:distal tail protein Dit [Halalkalibacter sp. APA_J-10(15)]|uniref:distal tail protein Dit n=1 Tax=Halalkalibacter sp. APA_J-10(15) TaxID=2933805 RepID=UPI001FF6FA6C|nr:distal tail protein Dit [Halalkalibacter sp. APA_J-10(15)]MCK0471390.1 phage tail family protein [Halalkalibacter sp. APA_J-10(15)]